MYNSENTILTVLHILKFLFSTLR